MGEIPIEDQIKLVQQGRIELFDRVVKEYEEKLLRYGRRFLSREEDIEEIVQEVFIKSYVNIKSFDSSKKFSPWIYRIAHNEFVNALKKRRPLYFFDLDVFFPYFISKENFNDEFDKKRMQEIINKYIGSLDYKYKEPVILYYFEDLSYKDISDILRIPVSTVGVRIKRAKKILKNLWTKKS
ncbi:MAG: hypothetical protein A2365_01835 [Candidatus Nealsonbacteria bacterium RIFOXYB1_FULL_40_15]|uniref:RNA polymerase sigma factor n=2 Tax=Candidatus Nealsoniibacteriota TaxID=1817911 RepID=A0A1G2ESR0_9BACT|nr:MAG: hypothetical protein A2365_01835 [Candidatus Nealsonbacteria bacterium RIFOXYB1_FULL_40_15]OGZ28855.1 MAG: hypothetical protein A2427_03740 [Candidatus Nealsonbacteria bacterium RIFOXYC1_FULL_40_7]OGZ29268.1 MAG: hypothetical protein A2562_00350 [Candidatus Nealsonbacteria bacterium RIFOXYD1_FULL_39_11]